MSKEADPRDWRSFCRSESLVLLEERFASSDSQHWNSLWQLLSSPFSAVGYIAWGTFFYMQDRARRSERRKRRRRPCKGKKSRFIYIEKQTKEVKSHSSLGKTPQHLNQIRILGFTWTNLNLLFVSEFDFRLLVFLVLFYFIRVLFSVL